MCLIYTHIFKVKFVKVMSGGIKKRKPNKNKMDNLNDNL